MKTALKISFTALLAWQTVLLVAQYSPSYTRNQRFMFDDADFAFYQGDYVYAVEVFEDLYKLDSLFPIINHRLGASYLKLNKAPKKVLSHLEVAIDADYVEAWYTYGEAMHLKGDLDEAQKAFEKYAQFKEAEMPPEMVNQKLQNIRVARRLMAHPVDVVVRNLGPEINSASSEYVPVVQSNDEVLYFTSRRPESTAGLKDPNGEFFEDIYIAKRENGKWAKAENIGLPLNSETHDATVSISGDGKSMIIYRTNPNLTGGDLYLSEWIKDSWSNPINLGPNINSEFQEASACLSPDKQTLYFSSNRPGGLGGKDIYRVKKLPNGQWSLPLNMGPSINTKYDEDAPWISPNGEYMYFASKGHENMGGYDIFKSNLNEEDFVSSPQNLGYPINTTGDDIYLAINNNGRKGYYSSDKKGGFGEQDLYELTLLYRSHKQIVVKGNVIDHNGDPIQANIQVNETESRNFSGEYNSHSENGSFILVLNPITRYTVTIKKEGYSSLMDEIYLDLPDEIISEEVIKPYVLIKK